MVLANVGDGSSDGLAGPSDIIRYLSSLAKTLLTSLLVTMGKLAVTLTTAVGAWPSMMIATHHKHFLITEIIN